MRYRNQRKWHRHEDDPASGLINLVDIWMVFSVVLLIALIANGAIHDTTSQPTRQTTTTYDSEGNLEIIERDGVHVNKMRMTKDQLSGTGERLGTAYRLETGEVLYVPEDPKPNTDH